jgi:hypothetical protein
VPEQKRVASLPGFPAVEQDVAVVLNGTFERC